MRPKLLVAVTKGRFAKAAVLLGLLLAARPAAATPVSLAFEGTWGFHDSQLDTPTFWAAMLTYGVTQGTPLSFSITIDDGAQGTPFGAGGVSLAYADAVRRVAFSVGSLSLQCEGSGCSVPVNGSSGRTAVAPSSFQTSGSILGPSIGYDFVPSFFDLRADPLTTSNSLTEVLADPLIWQNLFVTIGFADGPNGPGGGGLFMGHSNGLRFVSKTVAVPEMTALASTATGLLLFLVTVTGMAPRWRRAEKPR